MRMTYESMMLFAETWIAAWNRRDIDLCWHISLMKRSS
jgi:hypothetical protein